MLAAKNKPTLPPPTGDTGSVTPVSVSSNVVNDHLTITVNFSGISGTPYAKVFWQVDGGTIFGPTSESPFPVLGNGDQTYTIYPADHAMDIVSSGGISGFYYLYVILYNSEDDSQLGDATDGSTFRYIA